MWSLLFSILGSFLLSKSLFFLAGRGVSRPKWTRVGFCFCARYLPDSLGVCVSRTPEAEGPRQKKLTALVLQAGGGRGVVSSQCLLFQPFQSNFTRIRLSTTLEGLLSSERLKGLRENLRLFALPLYVNLLGLFLQPASLPARRDAASPPAPPAPPPGPWPVLAK